MVWCNFVDTAGSHHAYILLPPIAHSKGCSYLCWVWFHPLDVLNISHSHIESKCAGYCLWSCLLAVQSLEPGSPRKPFCYLEFLWMFSYDGLCYRRKVQQAEIFCNSTPQLRLCSRDLCERNLEERSSYDMLRDVCQAAKNFWNKYGASKLSAYEFLIPRHFYRLPDIEAVTVNLCFVDSVNKRRMKKQRKLNSSGWTLLAYFLWPPFLSNHIAWEYSSLLWVVLSRIDNPTVPDHGLDSGSSSFQSASLDSSNLPSHEPQRKRVRRHGYRYHSRRSR